MRFRGVLLVLFLLPVAVGLMYAAKAVGVPAAPECPGMPLDREGEESPGPMGPHSTCDLYDYTAHRAVAPAPARRAGRRTRVTGTGDRFTARASAGAPRGSGSRGGRGPAPVR